MENYRIVDIVRTLVKARKFIITLTTLIAITAIIYSLMTPKYWKSSTSFMINSQSSSMGFNLPGNISSLIGNTGIAGLLGGSAEQTDFLNIINSRTFAENVIRKFNLLDYLEIADPDTLKAMDIALQSYNDIVKASYSEKNQLIGISVETKDKQLSLDMCKYIRDKSVELKQKKDTKQKEVEYTFYKQRMDEYTNRLNDLLLSLKEFQEENNIIEIEQQTSAIVANYADVISQATALNIQTDVISSVYGDDFPEIKTLKKQRDLLYAELKKLESKDKSARSKYIVGLDLLPEIANKYANLLVEKEILERTLSSFYPIYEASRFSSIRKADLITVMDQPRLAGLRTKPKRTLIVVVTTFLGFLFSSIIAFFWNSKSDSEKDEWIALWKMFWGRK